MTTGYGFLRTMVQTRARGHTATGVVCYRMGLSATSTFVGEHGGERTFDYSRRTGIIATGYAAPPGTDQSWSDPITWAHRIEAIDKRKNSRQCRDDIVAIPIELVEAGLAEEAIQTYADRLAELHNTVIQWSYHRPDRGGKNHHGHVLYPGRHVEGLSFSKRRDREQDNPRVKGEPDLVSRHKAIWSEICRGRGIELRWSGETPGHHIGPQICATKRRRLVADTRDAIRETIAASATGEPVPEQRVLHDVAMIATGVDDGLTVKQMLQLELRHAQHGRAAPRAVPASMPDRPEVLPPTTAAPEVLPPEKVAPQVLPPVRRESQVLPPVYREAEVLPPVQIVPEVLPPVRRQPEVLPPVRKCEVLPPVRRRPEVLPPTREPDVLPPVQPVPRVQPMAQLVPQRLPQDGQAKMSPSPFQEPEREGELDPVELIVLAAEQKYPGESSATWRAVGNQLSAAYGSPAGRSARTAAERLGERARSREESSIDLPPAAEPSRIKALADWLLRCALAVLEHLGLKKKGTAGTGRSGAVAAPPAESSEASTSAVPRPEMEPRPESDHVYEIVLKYAPGRIEKHALPHEGHTLAVSNQSLTDLMAMLDNDDAVDKLGRAVLEQLAARHAQDEEERERAESALHWNAIRLAVDGEERRLERESESRSWFRKREVVELAPARRNAIARDVIRKQKLPGLRDEIRSVCRRMQAPAPQQPEAPSPAGERRWEPEKGRGDENPTR